eukprot:m.82202 g.82202  ORF g.82202 m.82202 type:complete len:1016 (-) comp12857_c0_seq4:129-3176(-)
MDGRQGYQKLSTSSSVSSEDWQALSRQPSLASLPASRQGSSTSYADFPTGRLAPRRDLSNRFTTRKPYLGLLSGVFIPSSIGLIGPTLFFRLSYVLSQAGLLMSLTMIALVGLLCFFTISGASALITNGRVRYGGGAYIIFSRTLGAEFGAALGVVLLVEHIIAMNLYLTISTEVVLKKKEVVVIPGQSIDQADAPDFVTSLFIKSGLLLCTTLISAFGHRNVSKFANAMFLVKTSAILIVISSFLFRPGHDLEHIYDNTTDDDDYITNATVQSFFTGPSIRSLRSNIYPHPHSGNIKLANDDFTDFLLLFSVIFAPFSSVLCGLNFAGVVQDPKRFPDGMTSSVIFGCCLYIIFCVTVAASVYKLEDLENGATGIVLNICISRYIVVVGMLACCLGTALFHLVAAIQTLQGMHNDRLIPGMKIMTRLLTKLKIKQWFSHADLALLWFISQLSLFNQKNTTTSRMYALLTVSFLFLTSTLNASVFTLLSINPPSFRPTFKTFNKLSTLLGTAIPLIFMVAIDHEITFVFVGFFVIVLACFSFMAPPVSFGEISSAILYHQVRRYLLQLSNPKKQNTAKFWVPSVLFFDSTLRDPRACQTSTGRVISILNQIKKGGLFLISSMVPLEFSKDTIGVRERTENRWSKILSKNNIKALPVISVGPSRREGFRHALLIAGLGRLKPNTVVLEWQPDSEPLCLELLRMSRDVMVTNLTLVMALNFHSDPNTGIRYNPRRYDDYDDADDHDEQVTQQHVDIVLTPIILEGSSVPLEEFSWPNHEHCITSSVMLASCLLRSRHWRRAALRLIIVTPKEDQEENERLRWTLWLKTVRITAKVVVVNLEEYHRLRQEEMEKQRHEQPQQENQDDEVQEGQSSTRVEKIQETPSRTSSLPIIGGLSSQTLQANSVRETHTRHRVHQDSTASISAAPPLWPPMIPPGSWVHTELSRTEKLDIITKAISKEKFRDRALLIVPFCPLALENTNDEEDRSFAAELTKLAAGISCPAFMLHSSQNVMHVDM